MFHKLSSFLFNIISLFPEYNQRKQAISKIITLDSNQSFFIFLHGKELEDVVNTTWLVILMNTVC